MAADRKTTFWYGRVDSGHTYRYELTVSGSYDLTDESDQETLIEEAADDYHSNRDGWEASWPCAFALAATKDGPEMARFEVDRETRPEFHAMRIAGVSLSAGEPFAPARTDGGKP